jgi:hypothetical protein
VGRKENLPSHTEIWKVEISWSRMMVNNRFVK